RRRALRAGRSGTSARNWSKPADTRLVKRAMAASPRAVWRRRWRVQEARTASKPGDRSTSSAKRSSPNRSGTNVQARPRRFLTPAAQPHSRHGLTRLQVRDDVEGPVVVGDEPVRAGRAGEL